MLPLALVTERQAERLRRWLVYVAPAVLGALVAPSIFAPDGYLASPGWDLAAYVLAAFVAATTRRLVTPLAVGVVALIVVTLMTSGLPR